MIKFRAFFIIGALALALAPMKTFASELEVSEDEVVVSSTETVESVDPVESESFIPDDNIDSDNGDYIPDYGEEWAEPEPGSEPTESESESSSDPSGDEFDLVDISGNDVSDGDVSGNDISGNDLPVDDNSNDSYDMQAISDYNTYYGSISTTYVEYMRGYLSKLLPDQHYVGARVGQYEYIFAFSNTLEYDNAFSGSNVMVAKWNTYNNGTFSFSREPSFSLSPGSNLVYSDLSDRYPSLAVSSDISLRQIVFLCAISLVFYTLSSFVRRNPLSFRRRRG